MTKPTRPGRILALLREEWRQLTTIRASDRPWQMPFAAALASGLPLLIGAWFDRMDHGLVSSLGGLVFLYLPETPMSHRMVSLMASAFGMTACYALGLMGHLMPPAMVLVLTLIAMLVTMVCRFYRLAPPGSLFFIMAAAIGAYSPGDLQQIPLKVGLLVMGCLLACLIAFAYSIHILRRRPAQPVMPLTAPSFDFVVFDAVVIGVFVGMSLALAQLLRLEKAYWVPVSCLAVIQGMSLRAVWDRQLQRIVGTGIGLLLSWGLLSLPLDKWSLPLCMIALTFIVETAVVRHYGFAAIFITPLTLLLAEATTLGHAPSSALIQARFFDTVLGSLVGLAGGVCLHSTRFRQVAGPALRKLAPTRSVA